MCVCDICCVAVLLQFLSHFLSVFPTVMSVTCGGLLYDGWTSVIAKHHKSILGEIVAQCSLHNAVGYFNTVFTKLLRAYITTAETAKYSKT